MFSGPWLLSVRYGRSRAPLPFSARRRREPAGRPRSVRRYGAVRGQAPQRPRRRSRSAPAGSDRPRRLRSRSARRRPKPRPTGVRGAVLLRLVVQGRAPRCRPVHPARPVRLPSPSPSPGRRLSPRPARRPRPPPYRSVRPAAGPVPAVRPLPPRRPPRPGAGRCSARRWPGRRTGRGRSRERRRDQLRCSVRRKALRAARLPRRPYSGRPRPRLLRLRVVRMPDPPGAVWGARTSPQRRHQHRHPCLHRHLHLHRRPRLRRRPLPRPRPSRCRSGRPVLMHRQLPGLATMSVP